MGYAIQFKPLALRQLEKLPREVQKRLAAKIEPLREDPLPHGCKKMAGIPDAWRIRAGDYRVFIKCIGEPYWFSCLRLGIGERLIDEAAYLTLCYSSTGDPRSPAA